MKHKNHKGSRNKNYSAPCKVSKSKEIWKTLQKSSAKKLMKNYWNYLEDANNNGIKKIDSHNCIKKKFLKHVKQVSNTK